ncbi:hypothetical protein ECANGB1_1062 [Enterospora canceri]|uniref:Uncharacterized protein n=1 Tax=Enterospora canceri TaxID=1081671 RepID=A0A1Y1S832_9MICR|nr:hypothetical protein ECANGB1_1062 [Enterospora canceri]
MTFKRKRNVKLDVLKAYNVFELNTFNEDEIEDYEENKATGMEEDEEKEVHLQQVMKGIGSEIPLPVIKEIRNTGRNKYKQQEIKNFINDQRDVENRFILDKAEQKELKSILNEKDPLAEEKESFLVNTKDIELIKEHNINQMTEKQCLDFKEAIKVLGSDIKHLNCIKNNKFIAFVLKKSLIHYEKHGFEAYTCFKPRIVEPKIKSRKNESNTTEKLVQMHKEFLFLLKGCELMAEKVEKEEEAVTSTLKLINDFGGIFNKKIRMKLETKQDTREACDLFYQRKKPKKNEDKNVLISKEILNKIDIEEKNENESEIKEKKAHSKTFSNRFVCELE